MDDVDENCWCYREGCGVGGEEGGGKGTAALDASRCGLSGGDVFLRMHCVRCAQSRAGKIRVPSYIAVNGLLTGVLSCWIHTCPPVIGGTAVRRSLHCAALPSAGSIYA